MARKIELTQGKHAIVDDEDYGWVSQWKWHVHRSNPGGETFYARCNMGAWPNQKKVYLHREIMKPPPGMQVDHIDGNGLNCTRANMRLATDTQNRYNQRPYSNNKSGFKGVVWNKPTKKWQARIGVNGKKISLGYYDSPEDAARAYDKAAREYHGEFAYTNFAPAKQL